jgi:hypothetical protein
MASEPKLAHKAYKDEMKKFGALLQHNSAQQNGLNARREELSYSPLISLGVKHVVNEEDLSSSDESGSDESSDTGSSDGTNTSNTTSTASRSTTGGERVYPQYGLLGSYIGAQNAGIDGGEPILFNTNAPSSTFICGSQGSGKSYTLACMLESCLVKDNSLGKLQQPLAGIVFQYDLDGGNTVSEAVSLCSRGIKVNVLVSRSNYHVLNRAYLKAAGAHRKNLTVTPLLFQDNQIDNKRMRKMMAFSESDGKVPLYLEVITGIARDMNINDIPWSLKEFEKRLNDQDFSPSQAPMLKMRLDLFKSFLKSGALQTYVKKSKQPPIPDYNVLTTEPGTLTIIDVSDDAVNANTACVLFETCLEVFMASKPQGGFVVALDEAHKFIDNSAQALDFTGTLMRLIREQRHTGARIFVATQEPTISAGLLDLCSVSIVHRFTSPAWFNAIRDHLGAASSLTMAQGPREDLFQKIVELQQGESFVFSPSSYLYLERWGDEKLRPVKLGNNILKMKTRKRMGVDGGKSVMAVKQEAKQKAKQDAKQAPPVMIFGAPAAGNTLPLR